MNKNIEQKIGFDRIRDMVAEQCSNDLARQMARQMAFATDFAPLADELALTREMLAIVSMESDFPSQDFIDLTPTLAHLRLGNTAISLEQLFDLRCSLRTIDECLHFFVDDEQDRYPLLKGLAMEVAESESFDITSKSGKTTWHVTLSSQLLKELTTLVDDHGQLYDNASPRLMEIRRTMARKAAEVDATVAAKLAHAKREGWAPEGAEPTIREGRLVIPMLDTHRRKMKGLILGESATRQTAFVEPSEVVELNNDLRELEFDERHEIQHILMDFSDRLRPRLPMLVEAYRFLARIDFLRAKARVGESMGAAVPRLVDRPAIDWLSARHPLLVLQKGLDHVVPFNLALGMTADKAAPSADDDAPSRILIISGPNAGGKSVTLKATGLIQYMLQCGLPVPVGDTSECGLFGDIFIDIGDQQSIDDDLSTYTSHLQNMKQLLGEANRSTLFLLDELGGGTEPRSGCAIAEAVLEELYDRGSFGVVTTHFADLKLMADRLPAIVNGAMLFDTDRMSPLYRLAIGHPGSSFAFEIARNIGFPDDVLRRAGEKVGSEQLNFEHQLQQLELDKQEVAKQREQLRAADDFLNEVTQKYQRLSDNLEGRKHDIIAKARQEAQQILADANRTIERTISDIKTANAEREATQRARQQVETMKEQIAKELVRSEQHKAEKRTPRGADSRQEKVEIKPGSIVRIDGQDTFGQVVEIKGKKAVVESNALRMTIALDRLEGTAKQKIPTSQGSKPKVQVSVMDDINDRRVHFNPTLDLRGYRADEAIDALNAFIDEALLLSEHEVRILHGTGYGVLKTIVRQELHANRSVRSFRPERLELGGEGITVAELK